MKGPVVLVGGGGHAKVIADMFQGNGIDVVGCLCPGEARELDDVPWLGQDSDAPALYARGLRQIHVAIGDNSLRRRLTSRFLHWGFTLVSVISPRAIVSPKAMVGVGVAVMPGAVINVHAQIGDGAIINTAASVDHDCQIGEYVHIGPGCRLAGKVVIGEGAFLGVGVAVIPEVHVGDWSIIGAGGVVTRAIPRGVTAVGVPARPIKDNI